MLKKHKKQIILAGIIILLPILAGVLLWDRLPNEIATHFDINNQPNGYSSKGFTVFGMPLFLLVLYIVCLFATAADPKLKNDDHKMFPLIIWIVPVISVLMSAITYLGALNYNVDVSTILLVFVSVLFMVMGNYLPKCQPSYTIGIKLPWTLENEDNWYKTHRLAGFLWTGSGLICLVSAIIKVYWLLPAVMAIMIFVPAIYSYLLYRKQK